MFDRYYCIKHFFRSKTLEKLFQKVPFTCTYKSVEKHVTCERFENAASRAKTNDFATVHFTDDYVSFYDGPGMLIRKTAKPCINSTWIALLILGFVLVKTWLLKVCFLCIKFRHIIRLSEPLLFGITTTQRKKVTTLLETPQNNKCSNYYSGVVPWSRKYHSAIVYTKFYWFTLYSHARFINRI